MGGYNKVLASNGAAVLETLKHFM